MLHSIIWILFIITVSSAEVYNEMSKDVIYPDGNDLAEPAVDEPDEAEYWQQNQLLYKLMKFLRGDNSRYEDPINQSWSELPTEKEPKTKRWFSLFNNSAAKSRPQRKWKIKKGKGPLLCYFKLCSFRNYY